MSTVRIPAGIYDTNPNVRGDLIRLMIEFRAGYERLCGQPPTCVHVSEGVAEALANRGFKIGALVAGMKIIVRPGVVADEAICSRDEKLFAAPVVTAKPKRAAPK